ncbi:MAG: DUF2442 domain-containing protein [Methylococcales bacterium]
MYPSVKKVLPNENYVLVLEFDNGERGTLDMKPFLEFGIFKRLKEDDAFKRVRVAFDTVEWDSGIDLDPEFVYSKCQVMHAQPVVPANG